MVEVVLYLSCRKGALYPGKITGVFFEVIQVMKGIGVCICDEVFPSIHSTFIFFGKWFKQISSIFVKFVDNQKMKKYGSKNPLG